MCKLTGDNRECEEQPPVCISAVITNGQRDVMLPPRQYGKVTCMDDSDESDAASRQRSSSSNEAPFTSSSVSWSSGISTNSGPLPTSRPEHRPPFQTLNATTRLATADTVLSNSSTLPVFHGWNSTSASSQVTNVIASATVSNTMPTRDQRPPSDTSATSVTQSDVATQSTTVSSVAGKMEVPASLVLTITMASITRAFSS